jgi:hypothetical protein
MNMNVESTASNATSRPTIKNACLSACRKLLTQIQRSKEAILAEFQNQFQVPEHLLRLAVNEAEALAWETRYPHLLFPMLATEKAEAVLNWQAHQQAMETAPRHTFA